MSDFTLDDPSFYEDFLVEAQEHFELIEQNFLTLEEDPGNLDILNAIFRSVHTIKGASGFLGLAKVQSLSHIGENILDELRKGRMSVSPEVVELLFETVDVLKVLVGDVGINLRKQGTPKDPDISGLIHRLEAFRSGTSAPKAPAPPPPSAPAADLKLPPRLQELDAESRKIIEDSLGAGGSLVALRIELLPALVGTPFNPMSMISMADLVGKLLHSTNLMKHAPGLDDFQADQFPFDLVLLIQPAESAEAVRKLFNGVKNVRVEYFHLTPDGAVALEPSSSAAARACSGRPAPRGGTQPPGPVGHGRQEDRSSSRAREGRQGQRHHPGQPDQA